jgi:type IV secretory pathway TrbD component
VGVGIGVVALLVGLLWVGQGLGLIGGSVMSGARQWFYIGLVVALVGVVLLVRSARRRPRPR